MTQDGLPARWSDECGRNRDGYLICRVWPECGDCPAAELELPEPEGNEELQGPAR